MQAAWGPSFATQVNFSLLVLYGNASARWSLITIHGLRISPDYLGSSLACENTRSN